jgi:hypothetical protein
MFSRREAVVRLPCASDVAVDRAGHARAFDPEDLVRALVGVCLDRTEERLP